MAVDYDEYKTPVSEEYPDYLPRGDGTYECTLVALRQHKEGLEKFFASVRIEEILDRNAEVSKRLTDPYVNKDGVSVPAQPFGTPRVGEVYSIAFNCGHEKAYTRKRARSSLVGLLAAAVGEDRLSAGFKTGPILQQFLDQTVADEEIGLPLTVRAKQSGAFTNYSFEPVK